MLIRRAEIDGRGPLDLRADAGRVLEIAAQLVAGPGERVVEADGGALLPGLHDHHIHLFALAAAERSVRCGPPTVRSPEELSRALREGPAGDEWIRGVGYHESVAGALDRKSLDVLEPRRPLRIQHRSGALWMLNSAAIAALGIDRDAMPDGVEVDAAGRPSGRLFDLDGWMRERLGHDEAPPDLSAVGRRLAAFGVTGLTDATPGNDSVAMQAFANAIQSGALPQRLVVMGKPGLAEAPRDLAHRLERGAVKIMLRERELPDFDALVATIGGAHAESRAVAIHCVTRAELVFATAVFAAAGSRPGDRIEHASVAPPETLSALADLALHVVTQPNFVRERGDAYLRDVEARDRPWLYRCRGLQESGIALGAGTDAPFGDPDPWIAMQAAVDRRTAAGEELGPAEGLSPEAALALFTTRADAPGGRPRRIEVGTPADFCLLDCPWSVAREELCGERVRATIREGAVTWLREGAS